MTITVLLILAVLWAAVLVPPALRSRSENRKGEPIGPLNLRGRGAGLGPSHRSLVGGSTLPGPFRPAAYPRRANGPSTARVRPPGEMSPTQRRRRDVLVTLLAAAGLSLVLAAFTGMLALWVVHGLVDLLLVGYLYLLVQLKQQGSARGALPAPIPLERPRQLRHVGHPTPQPPRELALRQTSAS